MHWLVLVSSVITVAIAWYAAVAARTKKKKGNSHSNNKTRQSANNGHQSAIYVIGDLHGDVDCARQWVERTGLVTAITNDDSTTGQQWMDPNSHMVFLGDYIDKGVQSKQTLEYVKDLTERFPTTVTALLGNHEFELLRDRTGVKPWGNDRAGYYQLVYATTHPAEYLNFVVDDTITPTDQLAVEHLYNASLEAYGHGLYRNTYMIPDLSVPESVLHLVQPETIRATVSERLAHFQDNYLKAFRSGTELGTWLETRPIAAVLHSLCTVDCRRTPRRCYKRWTTLID
jgi:predicted MPP superfamily phosphohydrolase